MDIATTCVTRHKFSNLKGLDPVTVYLEDLSKGKGQITIVCYGKSWTAFWGGMGEGTVANFFCSCDKHYLASNLSDVESEVYDLDKIQEDARKKGIECNRDDPWNDYELMSEMYGDQYSGESALPIIANHKYVYLCRIIKAVQDGLNLIKGK